MTSASDCTAKDGSYAVGSIRVRQNGFHDQRTVSLHMRAKRERQHQNEGP